MPVHRHLHDSAGSVYSYSSELDRWQQNRRVQIEEKEKSHVTPLLVDPKSGRKTSTLTEPRTWLAWGAVIVASLGTALFIIHGPITRPKIRSLAVLPFKNLSGDPSQEYLADGMTEALVGRLSGIRDLRVISRTSVMRLKDTKLSVPEIASTLGVDTVVEGSVIREGGRVRVNAQLIRGATDDHFWSEAYDRELPDTIQIESEVAQSIARKVEVTVSGEEQQRLTAVRRGFA
jgi:TolB-like protein